MDPMFGVLEYPLGVRREIEICEEDFTAWEQTLVDPEPPEMEAGPTEPAAGPKQPEAPPLISETAPEQSVPIELKTEDPEAGPRQATDDEIIATKKSLEPKAGAGRVQKKLSAAGRQASLGRIRNVLRTAGLLGKAGAKPGPRKSS